MGVEEREVGMREWYWRDLERDSERREMKRMMRMGTFNLVPIVCLDRRVVCVYELPWGGYKYN